MAWLTAKDMCRWRICKRKKQILNTCFRAILLYMLLTSSAFTNLSDGTVTADDTAITSTPRELHPPQQSGRTIIDWKSFDITTGETARFVQPTSASTGANPTAHTASIAEKNSPVKIGHEENILRIKFDLLKTDMILSRFNSQPAYVVQPSPILRNTLHNLLHRTI